MQIFFLSASILHLHVFEFIKQVLFVFGFLAYLDKACLTEFTAFHSFQFSFVTSTTKNVSITMWNDHHSGEDARRQSHSSSAVNDRVITNDSHAASALASIQQGAGTSYNIFPPQYSAPSSEIEYHHRQVGSHPPFGAAPQHHLYYHGQYPLPYTSHAEDNAPVGYQHSRYSSEEMKSDRYEGDNLLQRSYGNDGTGEYMQPSTVAGTQNSSSEGEGDEDSDDGEDDNQGETLQPVLRGKPEAMAKSMAAARIEVEKKEMDTLDTNNETDSDEDEVDQHTLLDHSQVDNTEDVKPEPLISSKKKKKFKPSQPMESSTAKKGTSNGSLKKKTIQKAKISSKPPTGTNKHREQKPKINRNELLLHERAPGISQSEYKNLEALMTQFCRVPLLAEFSRPVALLHPEVSY